MHNYHLVQKLYAENTSMRKFIEQYYSERVGYEITIELDRNADSSYFDRPKIKISIRNLMEFASYNQKMFRPMFYTLLLHEIGHAIYTHNLPYSLSANVLEDNRLEYQIASWNARVQFRLMRYIYQDELIKNVNHDKLLKNKKVIALALLRTVSNKQYVQALGFTLERKKIVSKILELNDEYMKKDYELQYASLTQTEELISIINQVDDLIDKLVEIAEQEQKEQKDQNSKDQSSDQQDDGSGQSQNDQEQDDDDDENQEQEQKQEQKQQNAGSGAGDEDDIQEELSRMLQESERLERDEYYDTPVLYNQQQDNDAYTKYKIGLFDSSRHSGIKGTNTLQSARGNIKQLNIRRYLRRHIVSGEKLFDRQSDTGRGGKNAKACFYIDISGSMNDYGKIRIASDYLKSFYDTMHKHMDIRMFAFGRTTYKITRNELNLTFLRERLEGATRLDEQRTKPNEKIVVITDGVIDNQLSDYIKRNAQFVIILDNDNPKVMRYFEERNKDYAHTIYVQRNDIVSGLEKATRSIREALLK